MFESPSPAGDLTKAVLDKHSYLESSERAFLKRLIEGTVERRISIDYVLNIYSSLPVSKMKKEVRTLLRMGVCQLLYMNGVKDHAAVSETVRIAKMTKVKQLSGFINAILRRIASERKSISWPKRSDGLIPYLSVNYSCPEWIADKLVREQGEEKAETVLSLSVSVRPVTARVNLSKCTVDEALALCRGKRSDICDIAIVLSDHDSIGTVPAVERGLVCIQDISSMLVGLTSGIKEYDTVLDVCASPGGKSLHAADLARGGHVTACDLSEKKAEAIRENAKRCGFSNIETKVCDMSVHVQEFEESADVVIADVPCSGLGVMGRKNDIKYNLTEDSIESLVRLQRNILKNAAGYVKPGGVLMFSTCTVSLDENQKNMEYLTEKCGLVPADFYDLLPAGLRDESARWGYLQLYGRWGSTDGFFIGKLVKR